MRSTDDSGNIVGIDAEIAAAIAEKLGLELQIDDMDFDGALAAAQSGKSDIVMAGVTVNEDRLLTLDFTETYANGVQKVIVPEGSDITSIEDMQGKMHRHPAWYHRLYPVLLRHLWRTAASARSHGHRL